MSNRIDRIADIDLTKPWAIEERRARDLLAAALKAEVVGDSVQGSKPSFMTPGDTMIINVFGPLFRYDNFYTEFGCGTSYDSIYRELELALNDHTVKNILFVIDSPGGEISGLAELSDYISEADQRKPIYSHIAGTGASAAYWLATATRRITATRVSYAGCVGALAIVTDDTRALEERGIDRFVFVSSVSPNKVDDPKTEEGATRIQARVDELGQIFIDYVATRRNIKPERVINEFGKGDVMISDKALSVGMIDGVMNLRGALKAIEEPEGIMLGTTEKTKDEIQEDELEPKTVDQPEEKPEEKPADAPPEEKPADPPEDKPEEDQEDAEEDMDEETAALIVKNPTLARKLQKMGASRERERVRGVVAAFDEHPYHKDMFRAALIDGKTTGEKFLMDSVKKSNAIKSGKLSALNADGRDLKPIDSTQSTGGSFEALERKAIEHAKSMGFGAKNKK